MTIIKRGHKELSQASILACCWPPGCEIMDLPWEEGE